MIDRIKISLKEKTELIKKQNNRCGICHKEFTGKYPLIPSIDHCHVTKKIRGILCKKCNSGLGFFKDNIANLNNALKWVTKE